MNLPANPPVRLHLSPLDRSIPHVSLASAQRHHKRHSVGLIIRRNRRSLPIDQPQHVLKIVFAPHFASSKRLQVRVARIHRKPTDLEQIVDLRFVGDERFANAGILLVGCEILRGGQIGFDNGNIEIVILLKGRQSLGLCV